MSQQLALFSLLSILCSDVTVMKDIAVFAVHDEAFICTQRFVIDLSFFWGPRILQYFTRFRCLIYYYLNLSWNLLGYVGLWFFEDLNHMLHRILRLILLAATGRRGRQLLISASNAHISRLLLPLNLFLPMHIIGIESLRG